MKEIPSIDTLRADLKDTALFDPPRARPLLSSILDRLEEIEIKFNAHSHVYTQKAIDDDGDELRLGPSESIP